MAKEVDTKVIQMQFDNGDFEKGVKESRKSIGELDDSIKHLSDSASGTDSIDKVHKVVVDKMSIMSSVINAAVSRITNNVLDSANKVVHAFDDLTIAPVSQGFSKYEQQLGSVQTIMNATGESIDTVQAQLKKLMWYTDETSYSYSDMADNIGKFTSAGVELDDAVTAMMGIANWAGVSGANVQQASRAMYNLSQAMGTGSLKLQDWMSIENANMATREFKQTLIDTAKEIGVLTEDTEITAENMRESLKDGWVTRDVLTKTLAKYGNYTEDLYKIVEEGIEGIDGATAAMDEYSKRYGTLMKELYDAVDKYGEDSEEFRAIVTKNALTMQTAMDLVDAQAKKEYNANLESIREGLIKVSDAYGFESEKFREEAEKNGFTVKDAAKMVLEGVESFKMAEVSLGEKSLRASQEAKTFKDAWDATIDGVSSSWLRFWQALFGNYEEAKELWTWLANDVFYEAFTAPIAAMADAMELAKEMGSLTELFEGFQLIWSGPEGDDGERHGGIVAILETIKQAFMDIFGIAEDSKELSFYIYALTVRFREWAASLTLTDEKMLALRETASNIFTMLKAVGEILFNLGWNVTRIIGAILPKRETILKLIGDIFGETAKVEEHVDTITNKITLITNIIVFSITVIKRLLVNAVKVLPQLIALVIASVVDTIYRFIHSDIFKAVTTVVTVVGGALITAVMFVVNQLSFLFTAIFNIIIAIIGVIEQFKNSEDKIEWLKEQFGEILKIFEPVKIIFDSVIQTFTLVTTVIGHLLNGIADFISKIDVWRAALILLVLTLVSNGVGLLSFLGMVGQGVVGFVKNFITTLNPIKAILHNFLSGISDAVDNLLNIIDVAKIEAMGHLIFTYALSVMMLAGAALMLSTIDEKKFGMAVGGTIGILAILYGFVFALNKLTSKKVITTVHDAVNNTTGLMEDITTITTTFKMGLGLIGIGFAAKAMAAVIRELGTVYDAVGRDPGAFIAIIGSTAILFAGLFGGIALLVDVIKKSTESKTNIKSDIKSLDGFVLNIDLLGGTLNKLALALIGIGIALAIMDFVDPDRLLTSAAVLGGAALALLLLSGTISVFTKKFLLEKNNDEQNKALAESMNGFNKVIGSIASGIFKISLSLALLSLIDENKLMSGIRGLTAVSLALVSVMAIFAMILERVNQEYIGDLKGQIGKFNNNIGASGNAGVYKTGLGGTDIIMAAFAIQMLSMALSTLALSIIPVTFVDVTKFSQAAFAIGALMTVMSGILGVFALGLNKANKVNSNDLVKVSTSIIIMAGSVAVIAAALLPLAAGMAVSQFVFKEKDTNPIERAADVIGSIIFAFAGYAATIIAALGIYQKRVDLFVNDDTFIAVAKSLMMMAVGVDLIALAIGSLMTIQMLTISKNEHSLRDATAAIAAVMGNITIMIVGLMLSMSTIAKNGGFSSADEVVKQTGKLLVLMSAAVTIVTGCIAGLSLISLIPNAKIKDASWAIGVIMLIMGSLGDLAVYLTSKGNFSTASILRALGETFIMMSTGLAIISAGIALIAYTLGKYDTDPSAIGFAIAGLAATFGEIGLYLFELGKEAQKHGDYTLELYQIAKSTLIMAASLVVVAFAISKVLSYGEDTWAGIGIFTTLVTIIGVYNAVMLKLTDKMQGGNVNQLLAISADFLIMAGALALIAPSIAQLAELQNQVPNGTIALSVVEGIVLPMVAMLGMVYALTELAKGKGKYANVYDILAISMLMVSLSAGMWLLAQAANTLANIDTEKIGKISASIVSTMVAFTICVGILTYLSDKTGDSVPKLAVSFLIFAASIWLVSEALDSLHTAMANILNDPNVQNFGDTLASFIQEHPIAAAATALGVGIGANMLLGFKDYLEKQGMNILDSPFNAIADKYKEFWRDKLFGTKDDQGNVLTVGWIPGLANTLKSGLLKAATFIETGLGAGTLAGSSEIAASGAITTVATALSTVLGTLFTVIGAAISSWDFTRDVITIIKGVNTGDWDKDEYWSPIAKFFYDRGAQFAEWEQEGYNSVHWDEENRWAADNNELDVTSFKDKTKNPKNKLENLVTRKAYDDVNTLMNRYYSRFNALPTVDQIIDEADSLRFWYGEEITDREVRKVYDDVYQLYYDTYFKARDEVAQKEAEAEKQRDEESKKRVADASKSIQKFLIDTYKTQEDGQKHVLSYEELIAALQAQYGQNAITRTDELQEAYRQAYNKAAMYVQSFAETEKNSRQAVARQNAELQKENEDRLNKEEEARIARLKAELNYNKDISEERRQYILDEIKSYETKDNLLTSINALQGVEDQTLGEILTKDGARNAEISEQNRLLTLQTGILQTNNALQGGGLGSIISEVSSSGDIIGTITKWINTWKDNKIQKLVNRFSGKGTNVSSSGLSAIFEQLVKGGSSWNNSTASSIIGLLGLSGSGAETTAKNIFQQLGGGLIDFSALSSFDINDITGSLERLIKGTDEGKNLFNEIFGLDASNFSVDAFLNKLAGDLNYEDIAKKLADKMGDTTTYEQTDWSKVTDVFGDEWNNIGSYSADSYASAFNTALGGATNQQKILSPIEQLGTKIPNIFDAAANVVTEIIERQAKAAEQAYTTAFEAAAEAYEKEFGEDTTLLGQTKSNIEAKSATIDDSVIMQGVYKKQYDYWNDRVKKLGSSILNEDGTYKEGTSEKKQKEYEEAVSNRDTYKSQLDQEKENEKALREELKWEKERKTYLEDPDKLAEAISKAEDEKDAIYQSMIDGTFDASTDIVAELQKANDKYDKLIELQNDIGEELVTSNPEDEENAIHEGFEFDSPYAKAARNALIKENNQLLQRRREIDNELTYLRQFNDKETKARIAELENERKTIVAQRAANKDFLNDMSTYESDRMRLEGLNKQIDRYKKMLSEGTYLLDDGTGTPNQNIYTILKGLERERDKYQKRIDQLDSLTASGIEEGKIETQTDATDINTLALASNTDALSKMTNALNTFGMSEEDKKAFYDAANQGLGDIPTSQDQINAYLEGQGLNTQYSAVVEQSQKEYDKIAADATANTQQMAKDAAASVETMGKNAGINAGPMGRDMLLGETTSTTTVNDVASAYTNIAAIRAASESINTKMDTLNARVDTLTETVTLMYGNTLNELALLSGWKGELGAHNAFVDLSLANIQNKGITIANRASFMREVTDTVDTALGEKATRRARGN